MLHDCIKRLITYCITCTVQSGYHPFVLRVQSQVVTISLCYLYNIKWLLPHCITYTVLGDNRPLCCLFFTRWLPIHCATCTVQSGHYSTVLFVLHKLIINPLHHKIGTILMVLLVLFKLVTIPSTVHVLYSYYSTILIVLYKNPFPMLRLQQSELLKENKAVAIPTLLFVL